MVSNDIILEVIQTADGYSIRRTDKDNISPKYSWDRDVWWGKDPYYYTWTKDHRRKNYKWKWWAIQKAKELEDKMNEEARERARRANFKEKKVWR